MTRLSDSQLKQLSAQIININGNQLTIGEATRWLLLLEAFDFIEQECEEQGVDFDIDNLTKKSKPHKAIVRYINERYIACLHDMFINSYLLGIK